MACDWVPLCAVVGHHELSMVTSQPEYWTLIIKVDRCCKRSCAGWEINIAITQLMSHPVIVYSQVSNLCCPRSWITYIYIRQYKMNNIIIFIYILFCGMRLNSRKLFLSTHYYIPHTPVVACLYTSDLLEPNEIFIQLM